MTVTKQDDAQPPWLLLVFSLPRKGASLRVTVWRKLQRYGALPLGNSGYFLPNTAENRERFEWLATAVRTARGEASVVEVQSIDNCSFPQMKQRFSEARTGDYRELLKELRKPPTPRNLSRVRRLRQRLQARHHQKRHSRPALSPPSRRAYDASLTPEDVRDRIEARASTGTRVPLQGGDVGPPVPPHRRARR